MIFASLVYRCQLVNPKLADTRFRLDDQKIQPLQSMMRVQTLEIPVSIQLESVMCQHRHLVMCQHTHVSIRWIEHGYVHTLMMVKHRKYHLWSVPG